MLAPISHAHAQATCVKVQVTGLRVTKGTVYVSIYKDQPSFLKIGKEIATNVIKVGKKDTLVETCFSGLAPGWYAIALYHDEDDNGKMNSGIFGIPLEPYGLSNNFRPKISYPKFDQSVSLPAIAQQSFITGTVTDAVSGEPLTYANVRLRNSTEGVFTDSLGGFMISASGSEATLVTTTVGYKAKTIKAKPGQSNVAITLSPLSIELREVMIKPPKRKKRVVDTAALYVLEQVQENKTANNPKHIPNYYLHEHNKLVISLLNVPEKFINRGIIRPFKFFFEKRDTTESGKVFAPLLIQEEYNETYHRATPALDNKVVYYRHISGLKKNFIANLVANQFKAIDIYENVYVITGKAFTSPFSPAARLTYSYHMLDTIRDASGVSYKINFVAKNKEDVALKGYAIVDSASWGIKYIHFRPNEKANVNFLTDYSVDQKFEKADKGWIMESEKINAIGNLLEKQKKLAVYLTKRTMRDSIQYDRAIPDSVNRSKDDIIAKDAFRKPASYMDSFRISPLDEAERHIYHSFDTAKNTPRLQTP
ncbi:unnamed protein product [Sphagnum jensenii]|uniref:Uncharacterized protein n=2 Tax=Sphagnum jensenii TaxID=128206 RepID=A0ABP1A2Z4_9BRYO